MESAAEGVAAAAAASAAPGWHGAPPGADSHSIAGESGSSEGTAVGGGLVRPGGFGDAWVDAAGPPLRQRRAPAPGSPGPRSRGAASGGGSSGAPAAGGAAGAEDWQAWQRMEVEQARQWAAEEARRRAEEGARRRAAERARQALERHRVSGGTITGKAGPVGGGWRFSRGSRPLDACFHPHRK
jgi:hypothetical protein